MIYTANTVNIDCSNITCEEFISLFIEGFKRAIVNHKSQYEDVKRVAYTNRKAMYLTQLQNEYETRKAKWIKFAESKWKTEKRRNKYIEDRTTEYFNQVERCYGEAKTCWDDKYDSPTFWDFDLEPASNGIHGSCVIGVKDLTSEYLSKTWEDIKDNRYFVKAKGWKYDLLINEGGWADHFRPQIHLILDNETQQEFDNAAESLYRAVTEFYSHGNIMD